MSSILAIDLGTSTIKTVVRDAVSGSTVAVHLARNDAAVRGLSHDRHEQDPLQIIARCRETMLAALRNPAVDATDIAAIAISGQMHGMLLVDRDLQPLTNLITWRDRRTPVETLPAGNPERTGCRLHPGYGGATLAWMADRGDIPENATALTIAGFLAATLTGDTAIDPTQAASWGILNLATGDWDSELVRDLGIPAAVLPPIRPSLLPLAPLAVEQAHSLGFPGVIPVCSPIGDAQAAVLAVAGYSDQVAVLNLGTGGQISVPVAQPAVIECIETRPMPLNGYLLVGASLCGGWSYMYLEQFFRAVAREFTGIDVDDAEVYRHMDSLAVAATDAGGISVNVRFNGSRCIPGSQGGIDGINTSNLTPANLVRGFTEGIVAELADMASKLGPGRFSRVILTGTLSHRSPLLLDIAQERFGVPCELCQTDEEGACGAAFAAAKVLDLTPAYAAAE